MSNTNQIDEIIISAFVDNQVDNETRVAIVKAMDEDSELRDQVYQMRKAKDLIKLSYASSKPSEFTDNKLTKPFHRQCMMRIAAALSAVAICLSSGYTGYHYSQSTMTDNSLAELSQEERQRIILHVDASDPEQFESTLAYTEKFLNEHKNSGKAQIEVVANAGGIDLLRADFPMSDKVARIMDEHDNITFIACTNALNKLRAQGINPTMVKDVKTETAALTHIIERLNSGWTYIKADSQAMINIKESLKI
jgi:intracellular sulfur oxidation DsrE/DsrF family protein